MVPVRFPMTVVAVCCLVAGPFGLSGCNAPSETPSEANQADRVDAATPSKPNIVYILADDMGIGDVSALNKDSRISTPHIDRLAKEGRVFTDAHSACSICTPTRYGILTGRYPWRTRLKRGVLWGYSRPLIEPDRMTVASMLKESGYNTACIGKWHLGMGLPVKGGGGVTESAAEVDRRAFIADIDWRGAIQGGPLSLGFDTFFGISASLDMHPYIYIRNDRFVGEATARKDFFFARGGNFGPAERDFEAVDVLPELASETVKYIEAQSAEKPFFIYMPLTAPHIPLVPREEFQGKSGLSPYGDFCLQVDETVGQVLNALDRKGFTDNTLVVFTADNGGAHYVGAAEMEKKGHYTNYVYRGYKADVFEGGHRVPFILRWPGKAKPGTRCAETIDLTDLLATCASIVGAKPTTPVRTATTSYRPSWANRWANPSATPPSIKPPMALSPSARASGNWPSAPVQAAGVNRRRRMLEARGCRRFSYSTSRTIPERSATCSKTILKSSRS